MEEEQKIESPKQPINLSASASFSKDEKEDEEKDENYSEKSDQENVLEELFDETSKLNEQSKENQDLHAQNISKVKERTKYFLDENSHKKFLDTMLRTLKLMIFFKVDKKYSISQFCLVKAFPQFH